MALALLHGRMEDVSLQFEEQQQLEEVLANAVAAKSRADLERLHALTVGLDDLVSATCLAGKGGAGPGHSAHQPGGSGAGGGREEEAGGGGVSIEIIQG